MTDLQSSVAALAGLLNQSQNTIFFTGAGISTESGIPDFRSPGTGLWNKIKPIQFQDFVNSQDARNESWQRKFDGDVMARAEPNAGHLAIQEWFGAGKLGGVITQNVDNLHQLSGLDEDRIVELHGNATYASCGGLIKTATISFGQSMPESEMAKAQQMVEACDLLIVLGSSLTVYPAAGFPQYAKQLGASLVIVNREATDQDHLADLVIHESIGQVMSAAVRQAQ
jgi:NAD-dependent deacetylase